ncbi:MAG TPA: divergent polysaccharide deacetylase family protein [Thermoanaerobaculia bacterium]
MSEPKRSGRRRPVLRRDPLGPRPPFRVLAMTIGLPLLAFLAFVLYQWFAAKAPSLPAAKPPKASEARATPKSPATAPRRGTPPAATPVTRRHGTIALILDDVGYDIAAARRAAALGVPLSFSVLPGTPHAADAANYLAGRGFQILCHLPMEPEGYPRTSPGDGAILTSMSDDEIRRRTVALLRDIPHAAGVNNHMGSVATADGRVMENVLAALRDEGVFFIDSRTTAKSVAIPVARDVGIPRGERSVFLDDDRSEGAIRQQLARLADAAAGGRTAIGIGHLYPTTLRVLEQELPRLRRQGFRFVTAGNALEGEVRREPGVGSR